jgi:hypothetical protein
MRPEVYKRLHLRNLAPAVFFHDECLEAHIMQNVCSPLEDS